ncbi:tetratricopeptide repeat protein, partial [Rickettsia sp. TH2014]|uniref:tetratricopeptide repeat protein n=1 Tax=Rickettsia sp. TH2014 TaxID=1967503 RepID=UPI001C483983
MTEHVSNLENKNTLNKLNKGYKLYNLERYEDALKEFNSAVAINEENMFGEAYLGKGASLSLLGKRELAEEAYGKAINKLCSGAYYNKGLLLSKADRIAEAHSCYERAIELEPNDPKLYCELGRNLGKFDGSFAKEAIKALDQAIMLKPHYAGAYYEQGVVFKKFERYEDAITAFNKAIELNPHYADAYCYKGAALYCLERYEEAIKEFDSAIALDPHEPVYFCNKGDALHKLERYAEAIKEFDKKIELKPDDADAYYSKGSCYNYLEQYDEAIKCC